MVFNLDYRARSRAIDPPLPRSVIPQATHDFRLLAAAAACRHLDDREISRRFALEPGYINRLYRSTAGRAFVGWVNDLSEEFREQFRLEEDHEASSEETEPQTADVPDGPKLYDPNNPRHSAFWDSLEGKSSSTPTSED